MAAPSKKIPLSREDTERFINYYLSHECLWNIGSPMYNKRETRQAAYGSIAALMGNITAEHVPGKISTLRTYYCKELRKECLSKRSGIGTSDIYTSNWEWFNLLDPFLRSQVHQKKTVDNLAIDVEREAAVSQEVGLRVLDNFDSEAQGDINYVTPSTSTEELPVPISTPNKRMKKDNGIQSQLVQTLKAIEQRRSERENDNAYLFGKYVASELVKVTDPRKQQELKIKIQQLIFDYQFDN